MEEDFLGLRHKQTHISPGHTNTQSQNIFVTVSYILRFNETSLTQSVYLTLKLMSVFEEIKY